MDAPKPDTTHKPKIPGQTIVEVIYTRSKEMRCLITIDKEGIYRVRTEFWDTSDWDIVTEAFWSEQSSGTLVDNLEHARQICSEYLYNH